MQFTVKNQCLTCIKKFNWNEIIIIKAPEWACFCLKCWDKYPDLKKYDGDINAWITHDFKWEEIFSHK